MHGLEKLIATISVSEPEGESHGPGACSVKNTCVLLHYEASLSAFLGSVNHRVPWDVPAWLRYRRESTVVDVGSHSASLPQLWLSSSGSWHALSPAFWEMETDYGKTLSS